jgi:hypothetical protein
VTAPSPSRALCPVEDCQHEFDLTVPSIPANALAEVFGFGVMAAVHQNRAIAGKEQELGDHFRTHTTAELVRSIVKAKKRAVSAESTCEELESTLEDLRERVEKLTRLLNPQPGDRVKGWLDDGPPTTGILLSDEEAAADRAPGPPPAPYYASIRVASGNVFVVLRESLRGAES